MRLMIRALIYVPLAFVLVLFAMSNRESAHLGLWPFDYSLELPLSIALLIAFAIAFLLGALLLWFSAISARLRARRAEHAIKMLESQVADLKSRLEAAEPKTPAEIEAPQRASLTTN
jgi:lipopolysaccharide assembly protein A